MTQYFSDNFQQQKQPHKDVVFQEVLFIRNYKSMQ